MNKDELKRQEELILAYRKACNTNNKTEIDAIGQALLTEFGERLIAFSLRRQLQRGRDRDDLIQEGRMAYLRAVMQFDFSLNKTFTTYAVIAIRRSVDRYMLRDNMVRIKTPELEGKRQAITHSLDSSPNETNGSDESSGKYETINSHGCFDSGEYQSNENSAEVKSILESKFLSSREKLILRMRFGIGGMEPAGFKEIGERIGASKQRADQIFRRIIRKVRAEYGGEPMKKSDDKVSKKCIESWSIRNGKLKTRD